MFRNSSGYLELFIGPMFSDKTSSTIKEITRWADIGAKVAYINFSEDTRKTEGSDGNVTTHSSQFRGLSPKISPFKVFNLKEVDIEEFDVIGIDEGQFYQDLHFQIEKWVNNDNKIIYCSGLDGDFNAAPFGEMLRLVPIADKVTKMRAKCDECLKILTENPSLHFSCAVVDAPFTGRLIESVEQKVIGGGDIYKPLCRFHYKENRKFHLVNK